MCVYKCWRSNRYFIVVPSEISMRPLIVNSKTILKINTVSDNNILRGEQKKFLAFGELAWETLIWSGTVADKERII